MIGVQEPLNTKSFANVSPMKKFLKKTRTACTFVCTCPGWFLRVYANSMDTWVSEVDVAGTAVWEPACRGPVCARGVGCSVHTCAQVYLRMRCFIWAGAWVWVRRVCAHLESLLLTVTAECVRSRLAPSPFLALPRETGWSEVCGWLVTSH